MIEVPPHVGEAEHTTPARTPRARRAVPRKLNGHHAVPASPSPPPSPSPASDPLELLTGPSSTLSFVVRDALDDLLLNVIKQLQHDLNHGPAAVRSKIASQFLPRIMKTLDKEEQEDQTALDQLREEMERLNQEMLHGDPRLYQPLNTATPDDDDLPMVDPETGVTVERTHGG